MKNLLILLAIPVFLFCLDDAANQGRKAAIEERKMRVAQLHLTLDVMQPNPCDGR